MSVRNLYVICATRKTNTHKTFEAGIGLWIDTRKVPMVIEFNQEACFKPYKDMNTELRTKVQMI